MFYKFLIIIVKSVSCGAAQLCPDVKHCEIRSG